MTHISNQISTLRVEQLEELNKYHNHPSKEEKYQAVRDATSALMMAIIESCPECADRTIALQRAREARMFANSAIALDGIES